MNIIRWAAILLALVLSATTAAVPSQNFETERQEGEQGRWLTYSDIVAGGNSIIEREIAEESGNRFMKMQGQLKSGFFYPFAGVQWLFNSNGTPRDVSNFTGLRFRARGDGNVYRVQLLLASVRDNNNYGFEFSTENEWRTYEVRFDQLKQEGWGSPVELDPAIARGVGFHIDGGVVDFEISLDDIELY
jgi:hypothetical protein